MSYAIRLPDALPDSDLDIIEPNNAKQPSAAFMIRLPDGFPQNLQQSEEIDMQQVNALQNKDSSPSCSTNGTGTGESDSSPRVSDISSSIIVEEQNHYSPCNEILSSNGGEIDNELIETATPDNVPQVLQKPVPTEPSAASPDKERAAGASLHQCDNCSHNITSVDPLYNHNWTHITSPEGTSKWICNYCNGRDTGAAKGKELSIIKKNQLKQMNWFVYVAQVESFDVASRDANVSMYDRQGVAANQVIDNYLKWLAFNNTKKNREACIRPHRHDSVPLIFFDDVEREVALLISDLYSACIVETSKEGGCHVWVHTDRHLSEHERYLVQKYLYKRIGADGGSISGEHWGRLCGYKNWKRNGCWVNLLAATCHKPLKITGAMLVDVAPIKASAAPIKAPAPTTGSNTQLCGSIAYPKSSISGSGDSTESGLEWGWACENLAKGVDANRVEDELYAKASSRKKAGAQRYARRTVERAKQHVGLNRL